MTPTAKRPWAGSSRRLRPGPAQSLALLDARLAALAHRASRFETLLGCTRRVGVSLRGDRQHRWGYLYDERDGTGLDLRPALARDRDRPRWWLLRLGTDRRCLSRPPDPNGTGDDALVGGRPARSATRLGALLRQLHRLEHRADVVERRSDRFDDWESCLAWLPVTESGDAGQDLGYVLANGSAEGPSHGPAIDVDTSGWDDPDYQLLAFRGRDRPFGPGECGTEPGESVDKTTSPRRDSREGETWADLRRGIRDLHEDVDDLAEPVDEITRFDQCLYTVGVAERTGFRFRSARGLESERPALAFDLRGPRLPAMSLLAFPGEEPPQIECNEDAGGVQTDE